MQHRRRTPGHLSAEPLPRRPALTSPNATTIEIPDDLKPADGRFGCGPSKVRPEQLAALAGARRRAHGHVATARSPSRTSSAASAPACATCSRCPTATRSCWATAAPPRSGTPLAFGLVRERALHLTYGEFSQQVRQGHRGRAVPRRPDRRDGRAGRRARADARPERRRRRLGAQRDLDRRDGRRSTRPAGRTRSSSSTRPPAPAACRSTPRRPTSTTSPRRSASPPTAACGSRCSARPRWSASRELDASRPLDPRVPLARHGAGELAQGPDLQHAGARRP